MKRLQANFDFDSFERKWQSPVVARERVGDFSGGILTPKYMTNLDSKGEGPPFIRSGRKIAYPVSELVKWLKERAV